MDYTCKAAFMGIVDGVETRFAPGDTIPAKAADEMGLAGKPDLATPNGKVGK